jgi:AraC family transcriptional regulator, regulatory protein of adaptative response / DNA-3-methyladenine glycosylase II
VPADPPDWSGDLEFRPPLHARALLRYLSARAVPGVEELDGETYRRSLRLARGGAVAELDLGAETVRLRLWLDDPRDRAAAVARCRQLLGLDADPAAAAGHLRADPLLAPLVAAAPGLRVPGSVDGPELAVRAVLGQQVSLAAARTAAGRLTAEHGEALARPRGAVAALFPGARALAAADPERLAMPRSRALALVGLAGAIARGELALDPGADRAATRARLLAMRGIGPWTAGYVAIRALGDPDVFLREDLGVRAALRALGANVGPERAARWAPWRSYATQYLWQSLAA